MSIYKEEILKIKEQIAEKYDALTQEEQNVFNNELYDRSPLKLRKHLKTTSPMLRTFSFVLRMAELNNDYIKMIKPEVRVDKKTVEAEKHLQKAMDAYSLIRGNYDLVSQLKRVLKSEVHFDATPEMLHQEHEQAYREILLDAGIDSVMVENTLMKILKTTAKK